MSLIRLQSVSIGFGHGLLLDKSNLNIQAREHIGLLGRNGEGKSTLLKVLTRELLPDDGTLQSQQTLSIQRLSQSVPLDLHKTVLAVVAEGLGDIAEAIIRYESLIHQASLSDKEHDELLNAQHRLDDEKGWDLLSRIETVISKMGLPREAKVEALSGGMRRRVLLAQCLLNEPDILLLDEPTNHLDLDAIEWLEQFLKTYPKTFILVTHDRQFLDNTCNNILELDRGKLTRYEGNYAYYQKQKALALESEEKANQEFDKNLAKEEVWIRQGIKARRTRNEGRVRALKALRNERQARRERQQTLDLTGNKLKQSGKVIFEADSINYSINGKQIIQDFSTLVMRGDKIGMVGPNGCGKTTLLKLLLGKLTEDSGQIKRGTGLEIAYFEQMRDMLEEDKSLVENVGKGSDFVEVFGESKHVIAYLQSFLFTPERARSPVKYLSGGEKNRLMLAILFTKEANVLVLDEPTNDLDIESLEILESFLVNYKGTVLIVSHDRAFLDNVVNALWVYEGNGQFNEYVGGYQDYIRARAHKSDKKPITSKAKSTQKESKIQTNPLSDKERKRLKLLPKKIEETETKIDAVEKTLSDPDLYSVDNKSKLDKYQSELAILESTLQSLFDEWEELEKKQSSSE